MKVIALGDVYSKYIMDDLPEQGVVIGATEEELRTLPPTILHREVEVVEKRPSRNCDRFRDVDEAYNQFMDYVRRENPACIKRSSLHTVWDALKWALGGENGEPDAPKKAWLVFHEEHEAGGYTKTEVAHICNSRLKAEEWLERDGAFITNMKDSDIKSDRYMGSSGDFDYHYYIKEMEVEA